MNTLVQHPGKMDKVHTLSTDHVHFGFDLDSATNAHLQRAATTISSREASLQALEDARRNAPEQLEVLTALYKFHFYQGEIGKAEDLVFQVLIKSSIRGGFSHDWQELTSASSQWDEIRGPAHAYLYALKALAFIRLRQVDLEDAQTILDALQRIDPRDHVGAEVIRDLLAGMRE